MTTPSVDQPTPNNDLTDTLIATQLALEAEGIQLANHRNRGRHEDARDQDQLTLSAAGGRLLKGALGRMEEAVEALMARRGPRKDAVFDEVTKGMTAGQIALITCRVIIDQITRDAPYTGVASAIGKRLQDEQQLTEFNRADPGYYKRVQDRVNRVGAGRTGKLKMLQDSFRISLGKEFASVHERKARTLAGALLLETFIAQTKLVVITSTRDGKHTRKYIQATPKTLEFIRKYNEEYGYYSPVTLPMVIPPKPWDNPVQGGYYTLSLPFVKQRVQKEEALAALCQGDLSRVYQAVNTLQEVPWRINKRVLDFALAALETPFAESVFPFVREPGKPVWNEEETDEDTPEMRKVRLENRRELALWHRSTNQNRSKELQVRCCLDLGKRYRDFEAVYFPHQVDFRGRIYSTPLWLGPQGPDYSRGLLEFAEGVELGTVGAYWLYVHAANCYGYDKVSLDERVQWVLDNLEEIVSAATDPFGSRWWTQGDPKKRLQFLAACFEIDGYLQTGPTYRSHIPVAVDGSCNGLQHLSAMLRDPVGGQHTNLVPSDKPSDIYAEVARVAKEILVGWAGDSDPDKAEAAYLAQDEEYRAKWAGRRPKDGDEGDQWSADRADWWAVANRYWGHLWATWKGFGRSLVKRSVMITPYGGTVQSMMEYLRQTYLDTVDADPSLAISHPDTTTKGLIVLTKAVHEAIGRVVVASRDAMQWLQQCSAVFTKPITWTVPSGFVVYQDYKDIKSHTIKTQVAGKVVALRFGVEQTEVDKAKARNGMSPNVIHSLDASALVDTVILGSTEGISAWSMIHDSYATHAARMPLLNHCLRKAFVETYSRKDILADLRDQFVAQCPEGDFPEVPQQGDLDLRRVMRSKYFFA